MNLLYITRKYPPMVGGLEKLSYALSLEFMQNVNTTLLKWGRSQKFLPYVLLRFTLQSLWIIPTKKITHIHIGDALLSPVGLLLKYIFNIKTSVTVAGLDVTFNFPGYQLLIPRCLKRLDKIICISNATYKECIKRGVPKEKCVIIPCGVYPDEFQAKTSRRDLRKFTHINLQNKKIIITVGRLVKRKGVSWFVEHVFPKLSHDYIYFIIGEGPEKERIQTLIRNLSLQNRVFLLGKISNDELKIIYNTADYFVMPNISENHNIEGFGIVAVEASSAGIPVIASNIEGISDAVIHKKTGLLVKEKDIQGILNALTYSAFKKEEIIDTVKKNFIWPVIAKQYIQAMHVCHA